MDDLKELAALAVKTLDDSGEDSGEDDGPPSARGLSVGQVAAAQAFIDAALAHPHNAVKAARALKDFVSLCQPGQEDGEED